MVPLATPEVLKRAARAAQVAHLVYNGGPLITKAQVCTIFWGSGWQPASASKLIPQVNGFFDYILTSSLVDQLAEYSVPQYQIGHGQRTGTVTLTTPDVTSKVDDSLIQQTIEQQISAGKFPAPIPI